MGEPMASELVAGEPLVELVERSEAVKRLRAERELGSTYLLGKDAARRAAARLAAELGEAEPRFADVDALRDFGRFAARRSRALPDDGVVVASAARSLPTMRTPALAELATLLSGWRPW